MFFFRGGPQPKREGLGRTVQWCVTNGVNIEGCDGNGLLSVEEKSAFADGVGTFLSRCYFLGWILHDLLRKSQSQIFQTFVL